MMKIAFRSALMAAALVAAFGASAQGTANETSPASKAGQRRGYVTSGQQEAAAARADRGQLTSEPRSEYMANAEARCQPLPEGFKQACLERVRGQGQFEGSVRGGGIIGASEYTGQFGTLQSVPGTNNTADAERAAARRGAERGVVLKKHHHHRKHRTAR